MMSGFMEFGVEKSCFPPQKIYHKLFDKVIEQIRDDEEVIMTFGGLKNLKSISKHEFEAVLVCTNQRMLLLNRSKRLAGVKSELASISYDNLNDVTFTKGIIYDTFTIDTKGEKFSLSVPRTISDTVLKFDIYQTLMSVKEARKQKTLAKEGQSLKQQLLDLKELFDLGVISEEEFVAKKTILLKK